MKNNDWIKAIKFRQTRINALTGKTITSHLSLYDDEREIASKYLTISFTNISFKTRDITRNVNFTNDIFFISLAALYIATTKSGICKKHLECGVKFVGSVLRFHVYNQLRRILHNPRLVNNYLSSRELRMLKIFLLVLHI